MSLHPLCVTSSILSLPAIFQRSGAHGRRAGVRGTVSGPDRGHRSGTGLWTSGQDPSPAAARPIDCPSRSWHRLAFTDSLFTDRLRSGLSAVFRCIWTPMADEVSGAPGRTPGRSQVSHTSAPTPVPHGPVHRYRFIRARAEGPLDRPATPGPSRAPKSWGTRFPEASPIEPASVTPRGCGTGSWSVRGRWPGSRGGDFRVARS